MRDVVFAHMIFDASNAASLLERWGEIVESSPRELDSFLYVFAQRDSTPIARLVNVYASGDTEAAVEALTPLLQIAPLSRRNSFPTRRSSPPIAPAPSDQTHEDTVAADPTAASASPLAVSA